ncbi:MAG: alpha-L-rhamnosidase N-terminal domain-containing protein, partial [Clostridia bacterium]|nr:alpha-L-rhamnosidase N-terminal domain-containing protein [Clostridia bacterium]
MTHAEIFKNAQWIVPKEDMTSAIFRKTFTLNKSNAKITICGLGYFILYINGKRVSQDELVPAYSDYIHRDLDKMELIYPLKDKTDNRIYCLQYDISDYVEAGENVLGVMVGGGYFHQTDRKAEGNMDYGNIRLCYIIESENDEIISDTATLY